MKTLAVFLFFAMSLLARAELPFKLPPKAKYTATPEAIAKAKTELSAHLGTNTLTLTNLFVSPMMCGPGLWHIFKDSPHFSKPPLAKTTVKIPIGRWKVQKLPLALLQSEAEVGSFRKALADLLSSQGSLRIREPNEDEFRKYWVALPYDVINEPLLVAEGKDATIFCQFGKGKIFWVDEVKRSYFKK